MLYRQVDPVQRHSTWVRYGITQDSIAQTILVRIILQSNLFHTLQYTKVHMLTPYPIGGMTGAKSQRRTLSINSLGSQAQVTSAPKPINTRQQQSIKSQPNHEKWLTSPSTPMHKKQGKKGKVRKKKKKREKRKKLLCLAPATPRLNRQAEGEINANRGLTFIFEGILHYAVHYKGNNRSISL